MSVFTGPPKRTKTLAELMEEADQPEHAAKWIKRPMDACAPSTFKTPAPEQWIDPDDIEIRAMTPGQYGVFAARPIAAGKVVTEYVGVMRKVPELQVRTHAIRVPGTSDTVIDGFAQRGTADTRAAGALINSTYDPASKSRNRQLANVRPEWTGPPSCRCFFVSTRDIEPNEQLLWFYSFSV
jgi:hypothetical protein